jgi:predicted TIM-barrel fold metal-dependent hydrolase
MSNDAPVICDCDMHVMEPADLWQRYIAPEYRHAAPIGLEEMPRDLRVRLKNRILLRLGPTRPMTEAPERPTGWRSEHEEAYAAAAAQSWSPASQIEAMDKEGIDLTVLFPSRGLSVLGLDTTRMMGNDGLEAGFAMAIARAYNDWLRDFCQEAPDRMFGAAMLAPHDVPGSVDEVHRCVEEFGFKAAFLSPGCIDRRPWHDAHYDPLWEACQKLNVPICFHGGGQNWLKPDFSLEIFDDCMMWHVFSQPLGIMVTATSLCAGGVLERFPDLRVGLLEGNCSWAPWLFNRMDEHYEWLGWFEAPDLPRSPSEYFKRSCFVSVEPDERTVGQYVEWFGDDNVLFSTDYPHGDSEFPHAVEKFWKLPLSEASKRKIVGGNFARLYDLPLAKKAR